MGKRLFLAPKRSLPRGGTFIARCPALWCRLTRTRFDDTPAEGICKRCRGSLQTAAPNRQRYTQTQIILVYDINMSRTNVDIDDRLIRRAQRISGLKTKKAVVHKALETFVRTEDRKGILHYYGSGVWKGDLKAMRRSRIR